MPASALLNRVWATIGQTCTVWHRGPNGPRRPAQEGLIKSPTEVSSRRLSKEGSPRGGPLLTTLFWQPSGRPHSSCSPAFPVPAQCQRCTNAAPVLNLYGLSLQTSWPLPCDPLLRSPTRVDPPLASQGKLVTGQNPQSSVSVAKLVVEALAA